MEERRKTVDYVTKNEFCAFKDRIDTALFAKDDNNDFGHPGIAVLMRELYQTGQVFCRLAKWAKRSIIFLVTVGAPAAAIGKTLGWW
jgi:hypothetical protein